MSIKMTVVFLGKHRTKPGLPRENIVGKLSTERAGVLFTAHEYYNSLMWPFLSAPASRDESFVIPWSALDSCDLTVVGHDVMQIPFKTGQNVLRISYTDAENGIFQTVYFMFMFNGFSVPKARALAQDIWDERGEALSEKSRSTRVRSWNE